MVSDSFGPRDPIGVSAMAPDPTAAPCDSCWIVREADHRVANHLAMLAGLVQQRASELSRQRGNLTLPQVLVALEGVRLQIGLTARLHRSLSGPQRTSMLDLGEHLRELCTSLLALAPGRIELAGDLSAGCMMEAEKILPLSCMIAEVLTNAAKHAASVDRICNVEVAWRATPDGGVIVRIADDGPGLPEGFDPSTDGGIGFQLLRALSRQLKAPVAFDSDASGLRFEVLVPGGRQAGAQ